MSPEQLARDTAWAQLVKQAQAAGFLVRFNHGGVLVIVRDPEEPPPAKSA